MQNFIVMLLFNKQSMHHRKYDIFIIDLFRGKAHIILSTYVTICLFV